MAVSIEECPYTTVRRNNQFTDGTKKCEFCVRRHENVGENHNMRTANQYH
jgi:Fe-S-cluster-containing dehydrogenase component